MLVPTSTGLIQKPVGVSGGFEGVKILFWQLQCNFLLIFIRGLRGPYGKGLVDHGRFVESRGIVLLLQPTDRSPRNLAR